MRRDHAPSIDRRAAELSEAVEAGRGILPEDVLRRADAVLERVLERAGISAEHTVVGFFGATGSGKSSLFNAVTGKKIARVAATRPATTAPAAAVWGDGDHQELTDWLGIESVHRLSGQPGSPSERSMWKRLRERLEGNARGASGGVVLVDLPDFDSIQHSHRDIVERFAERVDVMVWVFDPQKYSDHVIHAEFITPLAKHGGLMLAVLNQADRLDDRERSQVVDHLAERLAIDGASSHLARKPFAVSALDGTGLAELDEAIGDVVRGKHAVNARLAGDLDAVAESLAEYDGGPSASVLGDRAADDLAAGLYEAVRGESLVEASRRAQIRESARHTGWPPLRWARRLGRDPLRRVGITRPTGRDAGISRQALPALDAAARATVSASIRRSADEAADGVGEPWHHAVRDAARSRSGDLPDALERAVTASDFEMGARRWWWAPINLVQWLSVIVLVAGLAWLTGLFAADYLRVSLPEPPTIRDTGIPFPTALLGLGIALGILLSLVSGWARGLGARRHASRLRGRLLLQCREVAEREVLGPVHEVLERRERMVAALGRAREG